MSSYNNSRKFLFPIPKCIRTYRKDTIGGSNGLALTVVFSINMILIIVFNLLLIMGIIKTRKKKLTNSNKLFIFLCFSDLTAGCILMPMQIYFIQLESSMTCKQTFARAFWSVFSIVLSGSTILLIALDRYFMMSKQRLYKKYFNNKFLALYLGVEILVSGGWSVGYVFVVKSVEMTYLTNFFISLSVFELLILSTVVFLNFSMLCSVRRLQRNTSITQRDSEQVLSRTVTLISSALVICYMPSVVGLALTGLFIHYNKTDREKIRNITITLIWSLVPTQINSSLNAIIYLLRNSRIRRYFKSIIKGQSSGGGDSINDTIDSLASHKDIAYRFSTKPKPNNKTYVLGQVESNSKSSVINH